MSKHKQHTDFPCWCSTNEWKEVFSSGTYALLQCSECHTYRNDPPPISSEEESQEFYSEYYESKEKPGSTIRKAISSRNSRFWKVYDKIPTSIWAKKSSVMDIGCGSGSLVYELGQQGWIDVKGVDISKPRIKEARSNYPEFTFYDCDINQLQKEVPNQNLLILDNVIEHLPDPVLFVKQLKSMLNDQGFLVIITPNMDSGNFKLLQKRWTPELCPHAHIFLFVLESLARLVEESGMKVVQKGNFSISHNIYSNYIPRLKKLDLKGLVWRSMQDLGSLYGQVIRQGEMIYVVAQKNSDD